MPEPFLLHLSDNDEDYLPQVKRIIRGRTQVDLANMIPKTFTEVIIRARRKNIKHIATTSMTLWKLLLESEGAKVSAKNYYAGSIITKHLLGETYEFLFLNPLEQLVSTNTGQFIFERFITKFLTPTEWRDFPEFKFEVFNPAKFEALKSIADNATYIAIDIETTTEKSQERRITCVGFTFVKMETGTQTTVVVPCIDEFNLAVIRHFCGAAPPKVTQNGKYDISYFLRWNIHVHNWLCDTLHLFHSWYAELPKRLDFISSFMVRNWIYWKNEVTDEATYYQYNAKDSYITARIWYALLLEVPDWAITNYISEFQLVYPCLLAELRGLKRDNEAMAIEEKRFNLSLDAQLLKIRKMVSNPSYNPRSPPQTLKLLEVLGSGDLGSTDVKAMDKAKSRHPLNKKILGAIETYRKDAKLVGTYLRDADPKEPTFTKTWFGRILYELNPGGTDTGRLSSRESVFWCGWQIQNIPRDREDIQVRSGIIADEEFYFGECDRSQAEVRDTAYISGDKALIEAVDDKTKDYHSRNAAAFFGLKYEDICTSTQVGDGEWEHKIKDKPVRQVSKNTNHGANYNIGAAVLVDTMGVEAVKRAQKLLNLPINWKLTEVTQYLLNGFAKTYPVVKGAYQQKVISDVVSKHVLVGATGWTRYTFGHPERNKRDLNAYVAHPPQSLNAMELNYAYMRVFKEIALREPNDFKLGPQIHDSILFQYRKGRLDLPFAVQQCMINPLEVTDIFGVKRTLTVPTDLKAESARWSELKPITKKDYEKWLKSTDRMPIIQKAVGFS